MLYTQEISSIQLKKITHSQRIYSIELKGIEVGKYLNKINTISVRDMELIPYFRFLVSQEFEQIFNIQNILLNILNEYQTGAFLINFNDFDTNEESSIKLSTALSYLLGIPDADPLSRKYYSIFTVKHSDHPLPNLLRPYETFKMHTDGAYLKKVPDWIFFTKIAEQAALGGETRLLHIDDFADFNQFYIHSINKNKINFFSIPESTLATDRNHYNEENNTVRAAILNTENHYKSIRFVDRFIYPKNLAEAKFIFDLQNSLENSNAILNIPIPIGSILVLNNHRWLHGRNAFTTNNSLSRKLMRQRGCLISTPLT